MQNLLDTLLEPGQPRALNAQPAAITLAVHDLKRLGFTSVDPVIKAVLPPALAAAVALRRDKYIAALKAHNWDFEASSDDAVYGAGIRSMSRLMIDAASVDPDWSLWNSVAPQGQQRSRP